MRKPGFHRTLTKKDNGSIRFRIREFVWELLYAWQRAWRGFDSTDVFELGYNFVARMPILLTEFLKHNIGLFYDDETERVLSEEETDNVIKQMIFYFENCDEDHVYQRLYGRKDFEDDKHDREKWNTAYAETRRCRNEALRLFSKWCFDLWY